MPKVNCSVGEYFPKAEKTGAIEYFKAKSATSYGKTNQKRAPGLLFPPDFRDFQKAPKEVSGKRQTCHFQEKSVTAGRGIGRFGGGFAKASNCTIFR